MSLLKELRSKSTEAIIALILGIATIDIFSPLIGKTISNYISTQEANIFCAFIILYLCIPCIIAIISLTQQSGISKKTIFPASILFSIVILNIIVFWQLIAYNNLKIQNIVLWIYIICFVILIIIYILKEKRNDKLINKIFVGILILPAFGSLFLMCKNLEENEKLVAYKYPFALDIIANKYDKKILKTNLSRGEINYINNNLNLFDLPRRKLDLIRDGFIIQFANHKDEFEKISEYSDKLYIIEKLNTNKCKNYSDILLCISSTYESIKDENLSLFTAHVNNFLLSSNEPTPNEIKCYFQLKANLYYSEVLHRSLVTTRHKLNQEIRAQYTSLFKIIQLQGIFSFSLTLVCLLLLSTKYFKNDTSMLPNRWPIFTLFLIVLLMLGQLAKPIDIKDKNINSYAWPFSFSNWYLPGYVNSLDTHTDSRLPELLVGVAGQEISINNFNEGVAWDIQDSNHSIYPTPPNPIELNSLFELLNNNNRELIEELKKLDKTIKQSK